ncbi:uncharacterized protein LOC135497735 [Lineus longissimus]|uniref:uncharacterized protein LOC135497735 n=1 Tax=Lineus longissimus TaxID=88925 RepID=UPI00315D9C3B
MMYAASLLLLLCVSAIESTHGCKRTLYRQQRWELTKGCGWLWKKRCHVRYFYKQASYEVCCDGYGGDNCDYYVCGGRTNPNGACHTDIPSGRLIRKDGSSVTSSEGSCSSPGVCNCNKGFYSFYGLCNLCPDIRNCDYEECTNHYDTTCSICDGTHGPETCRGCNAFRRSPSKTSCIEQCSWRLTSTPCWPGQCGYMGYKNDCKCHEGFGGEKCFTITKPPSILQAGVKLSQGMGGGHYRTLVHNDPNEVKQARVYWTNAEASRISVDSKAQWKTKLPLKPRYISSDNRKTDISLGANMKIIYRQAAGTGNTTQYDCTSSPSPNEASCSEEVDLSERVKAHGRSITTEIDYILSGFVTIINQDTRQETKHNFISATSRFVLTFRWDLLKPYASHPRHLTLSTEKAESANESITAYWNGWRDDDSGLDNVTVGINRLVTTGDSLQDPCGGSDGFETMPYNNGHHTFNVSKPGVYSVVLTVSDKAGNHERARAFFTYDPDSTITIKNGTSIKIKGAVNNAAINWLNDLHKPIIMTYSKGRYINLNYAHGKWLGGIQKCYGMNDTYDEATGTRTTAPITNNQGVVKMEIGYALLNQPNIPIRYSDVDIFSTKASFNMSRADGDFIKFSIKVTDYMDRFLVENVIVGTDSTPPVINDLWLTREGSGRLAVHNSDDLQSMIFEWEAYDFHSGLREISWCIYDNQTDPKGIIHHGNQSVGHQGLHETLATCKSEYANTRHGPDCYCVAYLGCFHKDFEFKPFVSANNGLHPNRTKGQHNGDYFVEITAKNWAMLESKVTIKVTIDASPPRPGAVVDGMSGEPDVDYQSSRFLTAHWKGFFDHESGIAYYQFIWGTSCANASVFGISYDNSKVKKTTRGITRWIAPAGGRYFITVVAFNIALDHSIPVCSDGVIVDETGPVFGELTVENTKTIPGLVKENGTVYFVGVDRKKIRIRNPSKLCITNATNTTDITIYPDSTFSNGTIKTEGTDFCEAKHPMSLTSSTPLTKDRYISVNWTASDGESGIDGYQFGLMTNPNESQAPDILPFEQTNFGNVGHHKRHHPGLSAGREFYIILKAKNKAMLITTKVFGPFVVEVTPPKFNGKIMVRAVQGELVPEWHPMDFTDGESAGPHKYEVALGTVRGGTDVVPWSSLSPGAGCQLTSPPGCSHINMKSGSRQLHSGDSYYVSIKATNFAGLSVVATSDVVQHFSDPPAKGVVIDIAPAYARSVESFPTPENDIDYQLNTTSLKASWYGFDRPYNSIKYLAAVGTSPGSQDVASSREVTGSFYQFNDLELSAYKTYYTTIWASNGNGEISVSSDGVKVLRAKEVIAAKVYDGPGTCSPRVNESTCGRDIDYQASVSSFSAHWSIPNKVAPYITVVLWKIEQQNDVMDSTLWVTFEPFLRLPVTNSIAKGNLGLVSGKRYRSVVRLCHGDICFDDIYSDGVLVLAKPPAAGSIHVQYQEPKTINVMFDRFVDVDIPELYTDLSRSVIDVYEWTVAASRAPGQHIADWRKIEVNVTDIKKAEFVAVLDQSLSFKTCNRLVLRGFSKAGLSTTISKDIKNCNDIKPLAPVVIDAYGQPVLEKGNSFGRFLDFLWN